MAHDRDTYATSIGVDRTGAAGALHPPQNEILNPAGARVHTAPAGFKIIHTLLEKFLTNSIMKSNI